MKGVDDDKAALEKKVAAPSTPTAPKAVASKTETPAQAVLQEELIPAQAPKKFEGKGLAGIVKKLSEEKLEDKAKRITDKLEKNPDKKDKVVEKDKKPAAKKVVTEKKVAKK